MHRRARSWPQLDLFSSFEDPPRPAGDAGFERPAARAAVEWRFSRPALASPHLRRIRQRLDLVRRHFPELDGVTIRVGLARARGVLGWGSLDAAEPGIWVRPRRCELFTIAHELTHLLQARGLVPGGEATCDLYALARSPTLVDAEPGYLGCPPEWREGTGLVAGANEWLHRWAKAALAAHPERPRRAIAMYRRELAAVAPHALLPVRPGESLATLDGVLEVIP